MPNIKSAKKRVSVTAKKTARNKAIKSNLKTTVKKFNVAVQNSESSSNDLLKDAHSALDHAVSKGIIHKNAANRKKSRLAKSLNKNKVS